MIEITELDPDAAALTVDDLPGPSLGFGARPPSLGIIGLCFASARCVGNLRRLFAAELVTPRDPAAGLGEMIECAAADHVAIPRWTMIARAKRSNTALCFRDRR